MNIVTWIILLYLVCVYLVVDMIDSTGRELCKMDYALIILAPISLTIAFYSMYKEKQEERRRAKDVYEK